MRTPEALTENTTSFSPLDGLATARVVDKYLRMRSGFAPESPKPPKKLSLEEEIAEISSLKSSFYRALKTPEDRRPKTPLSFEPWSEVAKVKRIRREFAYNPSALNHALYTFNQELELQLITNLRERYSTSKSIIRYEITEGKKLRPDYAPNEDMETIFKRGQEWRKANGSNDLEREELEVQGAIKIQKMLTSPDAQIGTKVISISSPSQALNTPYTHNFVDIWELSADSTGDKYVQMTRYQAISDDENRKAAALNINHSYLAKYNPTGSIPLDAYFLGNPLLAPESFKSKSSDTLFNSYFKKDLNTMEEESFLGVSVVTKPYIQYFSAQLKKDPPDWIEIATSFNALINRSDAFLKEREEAEKTYKIDPKTFLKEYTTYTYQPVSRIDMKAQIQYWGSKQVKSIAAACGLSAGFGLSSGIESVIESLQNSVASSAFRMEGAGVLTGTDQYGSLQFECKSCKQRNTRPRNKLISACQHCNKDVSC